MLPFLSVDCGDSHAPSSLLGRIVPQKAAQRGSGPQPTPVPLCALIGEKGCLRQLTTRKGSVSVALPLLCRTSKDATHVFLAVCQNATANPGRDCSMEPRWLSNLTGRTGEPACDQARYKTKPQIAAAAISTGSGIFHLVNKSRVITAMSAVGMS